MDGFDGSGTSLWGEDVSDEVLRRLHGFGGGADGGAEESAESPPGPASANGNGAPHRVKRHPEDPRNAVADAAQEVADPEQIRIKAARLGFAAQVIDPAYFEWLTRPLYRSVHDVRAGAVVIAGQRQAGERLKTAAATGADVQAILAGGEADDAKATRLREDAVPRTERELAEAREKAERERERVERCRETVEDLREADEPKGPAEEKTRVRRGWRPRLSVANGGDLFARISLSPKKAWSVFTAEVGGTTLILAPKVSDVFEVDLVFGGLIALAISLSILVASFVAAIAAAAIRLPARLVGLLLVGAFAGILVKLVPGIDALREADPAGVGAMSAATLAACFVAAFTGYLFATREDRGEEVEERELKRGAGTRLQHALIRLAEAADAHKRAQRRAAHLECALAELWEEVEGFEDSARRATVRARQRETSGIEARAEAATIEAMVNAGVDQERAAARWATMVALLAHEKARLEEPPDEMELHLHLSPNGGVGAGERGRDPSGLQLAALGVAGGSGLASLALGVVPLGIGVPVAALLVLLDRRRRERRCASGPEQGPPRSGIVSPASDDSEPYVRQPDRMVPKYGDGGAKPGEHQ